VGADVAATSTVVKSGNVDIDGVLSGVRWASGSITYSFTTASSQYGYSVKGFQAFNADQKIATKAALANYSAVANLTFTEVSGGAGTLRFAESDDAGTAYAYYPHSSDIGGDSFFNHTDYNTAAKGTYSYLTFMHEIGHTLGLDHGQDGMGSLPSNHDSLEYSVMTYRSYVGANLNGYTVYQGSYPTTLMMADIAALQYMYGANYTTNAGNSTYKWNPTTGEMTLNGVSQGKSTTNTVFMTIWDGGGNDTYDFSSYTTALSINLTPGEWSITSTAQLAKLGSGQVARGNIANAWMHQNNTASLIENATGGSASDLIVGNDGANVLIGGNGNDSLKGLGGNDTIDGGQGVDTCYFAAVSTVCTVTYDSSAQYYLVSFAGGGTDTVYGVEYFAFTDKTIVAGVLSPDAPTLVSASPTDGTNNVKEDANIVLTFSENIVAGVGKVTIRQADGTVFQTFDMATAPAGVTISGKVLTVNPTGFLKAGAGYYVTIDAGAVKDTAGNVFAGIATTTDLNFVVENGILRGTARGETLTGSTIADRLYGEGGNDTLNGRDGNDTMDGGTGADNMSGGRGDDLFIVDNTGDKVTEASGQGTDTVQSSVTFTLSNDVEKLVLTGSSAINGTGNSLGNTLTGNTGANILYGRTGNDTINGGDGSDQLYGEAGLDVLTGGAGADRFVFNTALSTSNVDTITDFSVVDDTIVLARSIFSALPAGALSNANFALATDSDVNSARVVYNSSTGALFYDRDGVGSAADVKFAQLATGLSLTHADFLIV
jgi:serralysin